MHDDWAEMWRLSRARGYGMEELSEEPPRADEMDWRWGPPPPQSSVEHTPPSTQQCITYS